MQTSFSESNSADSRDPDSKSQWDEASTFIGRWARFCHNHYFVVVISWTVVAITLVAVVMFGPVDQRCVPDGANGQMQVCETTDHDWEVTFGEESLRKDALMDAWLKGKEAFKEITGRQFGAVPERSVALDDYAISFVYEYEDPMKADSSIFTSETVKAMCEHEAAVTFHPLYPQYCIVDTETKACKEQPTSIVRFFYPPHERNPADGGCKLLSEIEVEQRSKAVLSNLRTSINGFFVNQDADEGGYTNATRSMLQLGSPLAGFQDDADGKSFQLLLYDRFLQGWSCPSPDEDVGPYSGPDTCEHVTNNTSAKVRVEGPDMQLLERFGMRGFPDGGQYDGSIRSRYFNRPLEPLSDGTSMVSYFWSIRFQAKEFERVVNGDLNFAILSVIVVYLYIWFHVRSTFIASCSMLQIILTLPVGYFVYYNVLQYHYYSQLHILTVYLSLGIGADNVFVLMDAWRQSAANRDIKSTLGRLHYTLEREVKACFITTFTTVMSFVATSLTPIMPIHAFAVYASVVLVFNYLFAITLSPALVMVHHVFFSTRAGCCCCGCLAGSQCKPMEREEGDELRELRGRDGCFLKVGKRCAASDAEAPSKGAASTHSKPQVRAEIELSNQVLATAPGSAYVVADAAADNAAGVEGPIVVGAREGWVPLPSQSAMRDSGEQVVDVGGRGQGEAMAIRVVADSTSLAADDEELRPAEKFFRDTYSPVICGVAGGRKPVAWVILVLFASWAGVMIWQGLQLEPPSTAEAWFPSSHMMSKPLYDRMSKGWYGGADLEFLSIVFVFGVETIDRSVNPRYHEGYDWFFPGQNRGHVVLSDDFDTTTQAAQEFFVGACDEVRQAQCEVDGVCVYDTLIKPASPFVCVIEDLVAYYRARWPGADPEASHVPSQDFLQVWRSFLTDPDQFGANATGLLSAHQSKYQQTMGVIDGHVAFVTMRFVSSFPFPTPNGHTHQFYKSLQDRVARWRAEAPSEMSEVFQTDDRRATWGFTWMAVEDALVRNLLLGFAICFPVAFAVLALSTGNVVIAVYATLSIACIVAGVLGMVRLFLSWDLGIAESISGVIVIGFSVDYTVHLGHMYKNATHLDTCEEKTRYALTYIGPTVIGGGLTTLLSASVLFLCTLMFFTKMATLLVFTVLLSVMHAMLFFVALCAVAGPTQGFGDLPRVSRLLARSTSE